MRRFKCWTVCHLGSFVETESWRCQKSSTQEGEFSSRQSFWFETLWDYIFPIQNTIMVLEKTLESPGDSKEIKLVHPKGNQPWISLGKIEGRRRTGWQRMRWLDGITNSMDMSLSKLRRQWRTGKPGVLKSMGSQRVRHDWVTEQFKTHIFSIYCLVKISTYYFVRKMIYLFKI